MVKKSEPPLTVEIPGAGADQPSWMRVGVIAVIGFAVGIAWPRLAGVRLGPNAPGTAESAAPMASGLASTEKAVASPLGTNAPAASLTAPVASGPSPGNAAAPAPASSAIANTRVTVKPGILISCRTEGGETLRGKACGPISFDAIALPRLKRLANCPATAGSEGKLSPTFHLDFNSNKLTIQLGTKNTVGNIDSFSTCLGGLFEKVSINAVTHEHLKYSMTYNVLFAAGPGDGTSGSAAGSANAKTTPPTNSPTARGEATADNGDAKIAWDVAILRDAPRSGAIVGRLQRGASVQVLSTENNWYKVRGGTTEGWLYRGAIGR